MSNFYTTVIQKDKRFNSTTPVDDMALLEPGTRAAVIKFIALAAAEGHHLKVAETFRSQARQHLLYQKHLTQLSHVGCHGYGVAVDMNLLDPNYDPVGQHYGFFQSLAVHCGLISGIGWGTPKAKHTFTDWDHLQRVPIFRQAAMFAGTWYPPEHYDPYEDMKSAHINGM